MKAAYEVVAGEHFWSTLGALKGKYSKEQIAEIVGIVKECIRELQEIGRIEETGWSEHLLRRRPFADGNHFEFHIFDDDVLVVYFKRVKGRKIRMVGIYDHEGIPSLR